MNNDSSSPNKSITQSAPGSLSLKEEPGTAKRPKLVFFLAVAAMLVFIVGVAGWKALQISKAIAMGKAFRMPPDAITSVVVAEESISPVLEAVGSITSPQGVMLSADLPGTISAIRFESGSHATNGEILVQLDTRQEEAQLRTARAKLQLAAHNLERNTGLRQSHVIADYAYDESKSQYDAAVATAEEIQAVIERKTLRAPFAGDLGIRQVNAGQYLKSGDPIVQLESLDPVYANFALPQQNLGKLSLGQRILLRADGLPDKSFEGKITAINSAVDASTRNIQIQATIANPDHTLRSGMFAGVQVVLPNQEKMVMIPSTAIQYAPYGDSVFVIESMKDADGKEYLGVREQQVTLGKTRGDLVAVLKGLKPGDRVATSGIFKLRNGGAVKLNESVQPGHDPAPKPQDS